MEMVGGNSPQDKHPDGDRTAVGTMHWNNNGLNGSYSPVSTGGYRKLSTSLSEEFHVFSIQWDVNGIGWYVDDVRYSVDSTKWFHQTILPKGTSWFSNEQQHYTNRIENSLC